MEEGRFRNGPRNELITIVFHPWVKIGTLLAGYKMKDRTIRKQPINHMYKNDLFDLMFRLLHSFCRSSRAAPEGAGAEGPEIFEGHGGERAHAFLLSACALPARKCRGAQRCGEKQ